MIELMKKDILHEVSNEMKVHKAREFLQILTLKILYDKGYFKNLAFLGGTALRILHGLRRFSEDLDFSLIRDNGYRFDRFLDSVRREFEAWGLRLEIRSGREKTVRSAMLEFNNVMFELGLSPFKDEKLSIKVGIDQNPPAGWRTDVSLVSRDFLFSVTHFDLASMYATKLHACFYKRYAKGRDFYDLLWYLGKKATPNFGLLNNAILQTEGKNPKVNANNLRDFLLDKVKDINFDELRRDVEVFLVDKSELSLFDAEIVGRLLEGD